MPRLFLTVLGELRILTLLPWFVPFLLCGNACLFPYLYRVFLPRSCSDGKTQQAPYDPSIFFLQMNTLQGDALHCPTSLRQQQLCPGHILFCQPVWLWLDALIVFVCVCFTNSEWSLSLDTLRRELTTSKTEHCIPKHQVYIEINTLSLPSLITNSVFVKSLAKIFVQTQFKTYGKQSFVPNEPRSKKLKSFHAQALIRSQRGNSLPSWFLSCIQK